MSNNPNLADQCDVVGFLSRPETYGIATQPIRIDTHAAIVFLAGSHAYKMKRAVRYAFLDFSTLAQRRAVCEAELSLNRQYAPELYIDTLPVVRRNGTLALGGEGDVVEWLVRMRRFDPRNTLDHVADRGELADPIVAALAEIISTSHVTAAIGDGSAATRRLGDWMRDNIDELAESPDIIPSADVEALCQASQAEFDRLSDLLLSRGRAGFVRRCHGDLHLRNIVLIDGRPVLFDALEFDDTLATHDIFYDLAFVLMDLWQRNMRGPANRLLNRYLWRDSAVEAIEGCALLPLFMSIRAAIRAKVALSTARLEESRAAKNDIDAARHYVSFARNVLTVCRPTLIAIGGLSGSGKTTLSTALAPDLGRPPGAIHLRSDIERKRLFSVGDTERLPASTYTRETSDDIYARLREKAGRALEAGLSVIVDAVHSRSAERAAVEAVARDASVPFVGLWLDAPQDVLQTRVTARRGDASDADAKVVNDQASREVGSISWHRIDSAAGDELKRCKALLDGLSQSP